MVIDTGGLVESGIDRLLEQVNAQTQVAIEESEVVLLVLDARAGLNPADQEVAEKLRRSGKQVIAVVNKADTEADVALTSDFYRLGFAETVAVSPPHPPNLAPPLDRPANFLPP